MTFKSFRDMLSFVALIAFFSTVALPVWSLPGPHPPPSPAGGNYLSLVGDTDYAILDFKTFGAPLEEGTKEFTVEAWIYIVSEPEKMVHSTIMGPQVSIQLASFDNPFYQEIKKTVEWNRDDLLLMILVYANFCCGANTGFIPLTVSLGDWHHIAFQAGNNRTDWICDNRSESAPWGILGVQGVGGPQKISQFIPQKDFVLGGYGWNARVEQYSYGSFMGYIDEVRISTVSRYDVDKGDPIPQRRFESDADTVALWHFDEHIFSDVFLDSSPNKYDLVGMGGAVTRGPLAVNHYGKLATSWAAIKANGDEY